MAGTRKGGVNNFTVQEAMNTNLGQGGSMYTDSTSTDLIPPPGHVFIAIQANNSIVRFSTLESPEPDKYVNTAQATTCGGGTGGEAWSSTDYIPAGGVIYGRWNKINLAAGSNGIIAYVGK